MPKIPCPAGRRHPNGRAVWHKPLTDKNATSEDCPVCFRGREPKVEVVAETPAPKPTEEKPIEAAPAKPAAKPGIMRRLGFGSRETSPETPIAPPKNPEPTYFVGAEHVQKFANLVYGGLRWGFNMFDKWAMTEEAGMKRFTEQHPDLLRLSDFEKESIKLDPQTDMWGKFATGFTRMIGCRTQEQAHSAIATLDLLGHFGALIGFGADHIWSAIRAGKPFREAKKAAKKAAIAAKRKEVMNAQRDISQGESRMVPEIGRSSAASAS
jgi:hypothetical protein